MPNEQPLVLCAHCHAPESAQRLEEHFFRIVGRGVRVGSLLFCSSACVETYLKEDGAWSAIAESFSFERGKTCEHRITVAVKETKQYQDRIDATESTPEMGAEEKGVVGV